MNFKNIGKADRIVRIALGAVVAALGIAFRNPLGLVSLVLFATAAVGTCPIYLPFGLSTRGKAKA